MAVTNFKMHGVREIVLPSVGGEAIERHLDALENAVEKNPSLAFDLARTLIESVCRTILSDRGKDHEKLGFKDLLQRTYKAVNLVPDTHSAKQEVIESIQIILSGFEGVIQGLTNLRHSEGIASHGKPANVLQLESAQAMLAAKSADVVVHYLYTAHKNYEIPPQPPVLQYEDSSEFNGYIDENNDQVKVFQLTYQPSEVLFYTDDEAYRTLLAEFTAEEGNKE